MVGAVLCTKNIGLKRKVVVPSLNWKSTVSLILIVYAVLTIVYFYRTTGGASSVGLVDGQYVAMYKTRVIKMITEREYRLYPSLWTRVMSAWIGMMAWCMLTYAPGRELKGR